MELISKMQQLMATIINTMDEESQYDDYHMEFTTIESTTEFLEAVLPKDHDILRSYHDMWKALYENKGSLDCSVIEILSFKQTIDKSLLTDRPTL